MIQFKQEICRDLDAALRREWLETNGLGGFASSTITTQPTKTERLVETSRNVPTWRVSALTRDYPPCTWPTMRLTCERPVIGIAISSTTPSANAGSIFLKTSSILWSSASICASDAKLRLLLPQNNVTSRRWLSIDNRRSRAAGTPRYPLPLRTILFRPWPPQPTNTSSLAETRKPSSPAITGSATGAATQ